MALYMGNWNWNPLFSWIFTKTLLITGRGPTLFRGVISFCNTKAVLWLQVYDMFTSLKKFTFQSQRLHVWNIYFLRFIIDLCQIWVNIFKFRYNYLIIYIVIYIYIFTVYINPVGLCDSVLLLVVSTIHGANGIVW